MFDLWVINTNRATIPENIKRYGLIFKSKMKFCAAKIKGREKVAESELKETYLVTERERKNMQRAKIVGKGARPKKTPSVVFTPFPPLKPAKRGNICPNMAERPANMGKI